MPTELPSQRTLDEIPGRAVPFLRTLGTHKIIYSILAAHGFTPQQLSRGWELLHAACGFKGVLKVSAYDQNVREASQEVDESDEKVVALVGAATRHNHPDQYDYIFSGGLSAATGTGSLITMATLLDRLEALDSSPDRKDTRKADKAALETIAARGITPVERKRLRELVNVAMSAPEMIATASDIATDDDARNKDVVALYKWYTEWSETAHALIKRRDYLILLGLAKRKKPKKDKPS
jgi:hypothetical protein